MTLEPPITFCIVNYESAASLGPCLDSVKHFCGTVPYEVVIVNNDNSDLASFSGRARIIKATKNIGYGAGQNLGLSAARGSIFCLLNPDTAWQRGSAAEVLGMFKSDELLGIIGPRLVDVYGATQKWCAGTAPAIGEFVRYHLGIPRSKKIWSNLDGVSCDWVSGAALFIRRDIFRRLGGFDERFFMYFEDADLCIRARAAGVTIRYEPSLECIHYGGRSFRDGQEQKRCYYASQEYYMNKHYGVWHKRLLKLLRRLHSRTG